MADSKTNKTISDIKREIKEKTQLILETATNANLLVDVIELSDTDRSDVLLCFIKSVHKIFSKLLKENKLFANKKSETDNEETTEDPDDVFATWLNDKYIVVVRKLLECMHKTDQSVKELALCTLMKFVIAESKAKARANKNPTFVNSFFRKIFDGLVNPNHNMAELIARFEEYLEYDDVRFYVLKNLKRSIETLDDPKQATKCFIANAHAMLTLVKMPSSEDELSNFLLCESPSEPNSKDSKLQGPKSLKAHKKVFGSAWLGLTSLPLTQDTHKKVLLSLHNNVIPHMNDPKLLMDYLTDSYNIGGAISLLALNGLFILIHKHNLDYPEFYKKLYGLLQPGIFHAKYLSRFFHLLDLFLSSTHLPAYLVAAFLKRLSGLALSAPPSCVMLVVTFVANMLKRHPSCQVLIHRKKAGPLFLTENSDTLASEDPFLSEEEDPAKCNALQSSLWELKSLQQHYYPEVSPLVESLQKPLGKEEADLGKYFDVGYQICLTNIALMLHQRMLSWNSSPQMEFSENTSKNYGT
ncbi:predicted protein [Nematostella vectensis]|uniref:CCAAT-binding factor domain-containing protein n=1 Tax=Nematostella vectensis TaxID=45351 RepID=A7RX49_NEMVE|nr:predicted protein [Nematostella vectensis]|eukprot:XP_001636034.1 predicted protein [Nematostella vectensis]